MYMINVAWRAAAGELVGLDLGIGGTLGHDGVIITISGTVSRGV